MPQRNQVSIANTGAFVRNEGMTVSSIEKFRSITLAGLLLFWYSLANSGVVNLRCESLQNPLGIDAQKPRLSWELESDLHGEKQKSVQIIVAGSKARIDANIGDLWSATINDSKSFHVEYNGSPLQSELACWWKVRVTGTQGSYDWSAPAMWSMGLLASSDWEGAKWIGYDAPSEATPSPLLRKSFAISKTIKRAMAYVTSQGVYEIQINGAKVGDQILAPGWTDYRKRIMYQAYDVTGMLNTGGENAIGAMLGDGWYNAQMLTWPSRAVYGSNGRKLLFKLVVEYTDGSKTTVVSDDSWKMWQDGFVRSSDIYNGETFDARKRYQPSGMALNIIDDVDPSITYSGWTNINGKLDPSKWNGGTARAGVNAGEYCQFKSADCTRIKFYATTGPDRGQADIYVDGALRQTIDEYSASLLGSALLFDSGTLPAGSHSIKVVVKHQKNAAATDYWVECDKLETMAQQASLDLRDWSKPGFNDIAWIAPKMYAASAAAIVAQRSEPIRVTRELTPVNVSSPGAGVYIFDMGQNMVGWCRLKIKGFPGQIVTLRHGEMLNPDGTLYTANLRSATQKDVFTLDGADSVYEPRFTYHGFRYVEISGLTGAPTTDLVKGIVFNSDLSETGTFTCSNTMLNKLWSNILWTQRANFMSVPTDCPQRDERMGWMGDAQIFSQNAIFNMGADAFYSKFAQDMRDAQLPDGNFPGFAPHASNESFAAPAWSDAAVILPWQVYKNYGDRRLLEEHFPSVKKWVDLVNAWNPNHLWQKNRGADWNDWLDGNAIKVSGYPAGGSVPQEVFATAHFYNSALLAGKMAAVLGQTADSATYTTLANNIRSAFITAYANTSTGVISGNSQAGSALALNFNILPDSLRAKVAQNMNSLVVNAYDTRISTGIQSTIQLMLELSRWGYNETAYKLIESKRFPSWGYSIDQGATTIWERWDGYVSGRGFQDPGMNSFNHYALGAVGEWMYRVILGINPDEAQPGYAHFFIKPQPGGTLSSAQGSYNSISGIIRSAWRIERNGTFTLNVTVPGNTTAEISIPKRGYNNNWSVMENGNLCWSNNAYINGVAGISAGAADSSFVTFSLGAGSYNFQAGSSGLLGIRSRIESAISITRFRYDPLTGTILMRYSVANAAGNSELVTARLYDLRGIMVAELINDRQKPGSYNVVWQSQNHNGGRLAEGTIILRMRVGNKNCLTKKIVMVRE